MTKNELAKNLKKNCPNTLRAFTLKDIKEELSNECGIEFLLTEILFNNEFCIENNLPIISGLSSIIKKVYGSRLDFYINFLERVFKNDIFESLYKSFIDFISNDELLTDSEYMKIINYYSHLYSGYHGTRDFNQCRK